MNRSFCCLLIGLLALIGCVHEHHTTITLNDDGSITVYNVTVFNHDELVMMLDGHHMRPSMDIIEDDEQEEPEEDRTDPETDDDAEAALLRRLRQMTSESGPFIGADDVTMTVESVSIDGQRATVNTSTHFATAAAFAQHGQQTTGMMAWQGLTLAVDDDDTLTLSFSGMPSGMRQQQVSTQMRKQLVEQEVSGSMTIVMPGDIIDSDLPNQDGARTSISFSDDDSESLDAFFALVGRPATIRSGRGAFPAEHLPVRSTDELFVDGMDDEFSEDETEIAQTQDPEALGFRIEPHTITLRHHINLQESDIHYHHQASTLRCRIHPPPGVTIVRISNPQAVSAIDDHDRSLIDDSYHAGHRSSSHGGSRDQAHRDFDIPLPNIPTDSEAIEQFIGEVTIETNSGYVEHDIGAITTELADPELRHRLEEALPGTTVTITAVSREADDSGQQLNGNISISISGPVKHRADIQAIEFAAINNNEDQQHSHGNAWLHNERRTVEDDVFTRSGDLSWHLWARQADALQPVLRLNIPQGPQQHRLRFTLSELDLP